MKKLKNVILSAMLSVAMYGCICGGNYKYLIRQDGIAYNTNKIEYVDSCIEFTDSNDNLVTVCGNYSIEENKDYKPEKNR